MKILIAVTGGIAAYKAPSIISGLKSATKGINFMERSGGCIYEVRVEVEVMQTENSKNFVTEASLSNVANAYHEMFWTEPVHISSTDNLDMFVIVPATANIIGKIANGICDDLVTNTAMALSNDVIKTVCPALNTRMWENIAFQRNLKVLKNDGWKIIDPIEGKMACGTTGMGKLASTRKLVEGIMDIYHTVKGVK